MLESKASSEIFPSAHQTAFVLIHEGICMELESCDCEIFTIPYFATVWISNANVASLMEPFDQSMASFLICDLSFNTDCVSDLLFAYDANLSRPASRFDNIAWSGMDGAIRDNIPEVCNIILISTTVPPSSVPSKPHVFCSVVMILLPFRSPEVTSTTYFPSGSWAY